jgi:hypothetical protein
MVLGVVDCLVSVVNYWSCAISIELGTYYEPGSVKLNDGSVTFEFASLAKFRVGNVLEDETGSDAMRAFVQHWTAR